MARAFQCNRCKSFYESERHNTILKVSLYGNPVIDFKVYVDVDLCPACTKELKDFLHIQEDENET